VLRGDLSSESNLVNEQCFVSFGALLSVCRLFGRETGKECVMQIHWTEQTKDARTKKGTVSQRKESDRVFVVPQKFSLWSVRSSRL